MIIPQTITEYQEPVIDNQYTGTYPELSMYPKPRCTNPSLLQKSKREKAIFQRTPQKSSGTHPCYGYVRSFTHSLESYERAACKEYIILMRNQEYTKQYPNFHIIITFQKMMSIKDFSKVRGKTFGYLTKWKVLAYYTQEPTEDNNRFHIHIIAIYGGSQDSLRDCVKIALKLAGLEYAQDFRVKVLPATATSEDYKRLCSYILKFNGKRHHNRRKPTLFIKGLGIRKTGSFGKWFAKPKTVLWKEYRAELQMKHEAAE